MTTTDPPADSDKGTSSTPAIANLRRVGGMALTALSRRLTSTSPWRRSAARQPVRPTGSMAPSIPPSVAGLTACLPTLTLIRTPHLTLASLRLKSAAPGATLPRSLADDVLSARYAALERFYVDACRDAYRQARLAEILGAELPDLQAAKVALPSDNGTNPHPLDLHGRALGLRRRPGLPRSRPTSDTLVRGRTPASLPRPCRKHTRTERGRARRQRREVEQLKQNTSRHRRDVDAALRVLAGIPPANAPVVPSSSPGGRYRCAIRPGRRYPQATTTPTRPRTGALASSPPTTPPAFVAMFDPLYLRARNVGRGGAGRRRHRE